MGIDRLALPWPAYIPNPFFGQMWCTSNVGGCVFFSLFDPEEIPDFFCELMEYTCSAPALNKELSMVAMVS